MIKQKKQEAKSKDKCGKIFTTPIRNRVNHFKI